MTSRGEKDDFESPTAVQLSLSGNEAIGASTKPITMNCRDRRLRMRSHRDPAGFVMTVFISRARLFIIQMLGLL